MDENNLNNQNPAQQPEQDDVSKLDKLIQNNPFVKIGTASYENAQTQSVVMSTREDANSQLASVNAQNAEILRQQKHAEDARKAKRTLAYVLFAIVFVAILGAGGWLVYSALIAGQKTVTPEEIISDEGETKYGRVEGYKCTSEKCAKAADIDTNRIIVNDSNQYYIYNKSSKQKILTTIESKDYHEIMIFKWANNDYAVLDPESGLSALYNIGSNFQVTSFAYDEFYTDINAEVYKDMTSIASNYIVARNGSSYRLIDLSSGEEKVRAAKKVFAYDQYYFAYENDGTIHVYNDAKKQIVIIAANETAFVKNSYLVIAKSNGATTVYETSGSKANSNNDFVKTLNKIQQKSRLSTLLNDKSYFRILANN